MQEVMSLFLNFVSISAHSVIRDFGLSFNPCYINLFAYVELFTLYRERLQIW